MSAQSIYDTWHGMTEVNEGITSRMYITFNKKDNSFVMTSQTSCADEDKS